MIYIELPDGRKVSWLVISIGVGGAAASLIGLGVAVFAPDLLPDRLPALVFVFLLAMFATIALPLPATWRTYDATMLTAQEREQTAQARERFERSLFAGWTGGAVYEQQAASSDTSAASEDQDLGGRDVRVKDKSGEHLLRLPTDPAERAKLEARARLIARWRWSLSQVLAWAMLKGGLRVVDLVGKGLALSSATSHTEITNELAKMGIVNKENGVTTTLIEGMTYHRAIMLVNDPTAYRLRAYNFPEVEPPRVREVPKATLPL